MNRYSVYFALLLLLVFTACTKDTLVPTAEETLMASFDTEEFGAGESAEAAEILLAKEYSETSAAIEAALLRKTRVVTVPAGSMDAIAAAIAQVGKHGVVRLASGDHTETDNLVISSSVTLVGDEGARILFPNTTIVPTQLPIIPAIYVLGANRVRIKGIELVPADGPGGTALLVQNSPNTFIADVTAQNWQFGLIAEKSPRMYVGKSTFVGSSQWQTDPSFSCFGIVNVNGERVRVFSNTIQNTVFGIWACDKRGRMIANNFSGNYNGVVLCTVPPNSFPLPDGQFIGSAVSAANWTVSKNDASNNFNSGYEIIDGANRCALWNNTGTGNGIQDYEFAGETPRYGFVAPTSSRNWAAIKPASSWKDCGDGNRVFGGMEIDLGESACF